MPPPLFDDMQIANALRNDAQPALERLAQSSSFRERALARFDRDEPPPYVSSTEEEDDDEMPYPTLTYTNNNAMPDELLSILDEPFDDVELGGVASHMANSTEVYRPGARYNDEVEIERERIRNWAETKARTDTKDFLIQYGPARKGRAGRARVNIIARRNIKRRWQKLGVWNPEWGFPGRDNPQPQDDRYKWKWPWQHGDAAAEWQHRDPADTKWHPGKKLSQNLHHPITRALRLRQGLRRGEHVPVPPRSHLEENASTSQAESFITSRPWFMFEMETVEEYWRSLRLANNMQMSRLYKGSKGGNIRAMWEERRDWMDEWRDPILGKTLIGWKWRHESPSPEPESLSGLDDLATFELTPSEVDALEAIPPPSPPTPPRVYVPPSEPTDSLFGPSTLLFGRPISLFGGGVPEGAPPAAVTKRIDEQSSTASPEPPERPPPRRRRQRQETPARPLRRSARIAAITASRPPPAPPPPRVSKPPTRPKRQRKKPKRR